MRYISLGIVILLIMTIVSADNVTLHVFPRGGASVTGSSLIVSTRAYVEKWINITGIGNAFIKIQTTQGYSSNVSGVSGLNITSDVCVGASCGYVYEGNIVNGVLTCNPFYYETFQECSSDSGLQCDVGPALCCLPKECSYAANCYDSGTTANIKTGGGEDLEFCYLGEWKDQDEDQSYCQYFWDNTGDGAFAEYGAGETECCGDDSGENVGTCAADSSVSDNAAVCPGSDNSACCDLANDCVDDGICYDSTTTAANDADGDGDNDWCDAGTWRDCYDDDDCTGDLQCINNECQLLDVGVANIVPKYLSGQTNYTAGIFNLSSAVSHNMGIDNSTCKYTTNNGTNWFSADYVGNDTDGICYKYLTVSDEIIVLARIKVNSTTEVTQTSNMTNVTVDAQSPTLTSITLNNTLIANGTDIDYTIVDTPSVGLMSVIWSLDMGITNHSFMNLTYEETNDSCGVYQDCQGATVNITYGYGVHDNLLGNNSDSLFGEKNTAGAGALDDDALLCGGSGNESCYANLTIDGIPDDTYGFWYYTYGAFSNYINVSVDNSTWKQSLESGAWHWEYVQDVTVSGNKLDVYLAGGALLNVSVKSYFDQVLLEPKAAGASTQDLKTAAFNKGYTWVDVWAKDFLGNYEHKRFKYDIGTSVDFNVTDITQNTFNFTKVFVLQQDGDYKNTTHRESYQMLTTLNPVLNRLFSIESLVDIYVEIPTTFGTAKLTISDANITSEEVKIRLVADDNYTGYRPIRGPMSDFFIVNPSGVNFSTYDFYIPYNSTFLTPNYFLHCTNFDFTANNCTSWSIENITSSSYLTSTEDVAKKTPLRCVEFQDFDKFSPDTFSLYAPMGGGFAPLFFDDFEYIMEFWRTVSANVQIDSRDAFSGDSAAYAVGIGDSNAWFIKDVTYNSSQFPFLSFAYKVPSGGKFNFEVYSDTDSQWITYNGTEDKMNYSIPGFVDDNQWRFAMISIDKDLDELFNSAIMSGHIITKIRYGTESSFGSSDEFYVDDVLVANTPPQGLGDIQYSNDFDYQYEIDEFFKNNATAVLYVNSYTGLNSMNVTCSGVSCRVVKPLHYLLREFPIIDFAYKVPSSSQTGLIIGYTNRTSGVSENKCFNISFASAPSICDSFHQIIGVTSDNTWRSKNILLTSFFDTDNEYEINNLKFRSLGSSDTFYIDTFEVRRQDQGGCESCVNTVSYTEKYFSDGSASKDVTVYDSDGFNSTFRVSIPKEAAIQDALIYFDAYKDLTAEGALDTITAADSDDAGMESLMGLDSDANFLYVTDVARRNVKIFYPNKTLKDYIEMDTSLVSSDPIGVAVNSTGFIFVVDRYIDQHNVRVFDSDGNAHSSFGASELSQPWDVAITSSKIYVTDESNGNIKVFDLDYTLSNTITGFVKPHGIHVNSSGNIFLADDCRVRILKPDGSILSEIGSPTNNCGKADYLLNVVSDVSTDSYGKIYVADTGNHRIQVYDSRGTYRNTIGTGDCSTASGGLCNPYAVEIDSGNLVYIADTSNARVQKFSVLTQAFTADIGSDSLSKITAIGVSNITSELQNLADSCTCSGCSTQDYTCFVEVNVTSSDNIFIGQLSLTYSGSVNDFVVDYVSDFEANYGGWASYAGASTLSKISKDKSTSYFGRESLRVNFSAGGSMFADFRPKNGLSFDTNKRPYLMFAYKAPSGRPLKLVLSNGTYDFVWNGSALLSESEIYMGEIPDFVADDTWRSAVIPVDDDLDTKYGDILHNITGVRIGNNTESSSNSAFWLDDFVVASKPPTQCPYQQIKKEYSFSAASFDGGGGGEGKPDLNISDSDISPNPSSPNNEDSVVYTVTVRNDGDTTASNVNVTCEIDDIQFSFNDSLGDLPVGSDTITCTWTAEYGNHAFRANSTTTTEEVSVINNWGEYNITVADNVSPVLIVYEPVPDGFYSNPVALNYTVTDDSDSSLDCEYVLNSTYVVNSGSVSNNTYDYENMDTDGGSNTVYVTCLDDSNNRGNSSLISFNSECTAGTQCENGDVCLRDNTGFGICANCTSTFIYNICSNATLGDYELNTLNSLCWTSGGSEFACLPAINTSSGYPKVYQSELERTNLYVDINDTIELRNSLATKIGTITGTTLQMDCSQGVCSFTNQSSYILTTTAIETRTAQLGSTTNNECGDWRIYSEIINLTGQESSDYELNTTGVDATSALAAYANVTVDDVILEKASDVWLSITDENLTVSVITAYCTGNETRTHSVECYLDCDPQDADNINSCSKNIGNSSSYGNYSISSTLTAGNHQLTVANMTPLDSHWIYCVSNDEVFSPLDTDGYILSEKFSTAVSTKIAVTTIEPYNEDDDITIQVNSSDVDNIDNIDYIQLRVNSSAGNLFFDNLTTTTGGDCSAIDSKNYTCDITIKSIDAGVYSAVGRTENNAQFFAEASTSFSVQGLSCLLSVQNNTVQGKISTARFNVIRIPEGDIEGFAIVFYNDSDFVATATSDVNGFAEVDFTTPLAGIHNYTITCEKESLSDDYTIWIGTVGSSLTVTPNSKVFQLGTVELNAYTYVLDNPSSNEQSYNLTLRSTEIISRFSENEKTTFEVTIPAESKYTGHIDILPTKIGSEEIEIWFVNINSDADSIDDELDHVKFDATVRSAYSVGAFDIEIASGLEFIQIAMLLIFALVYVYRFVI